MFISEFLHTFLDLFYPRTCLHCDRSLNDSYELYICEDCKKQIRHVRDHACVRCGASLGPHVKSAEKEGCLFCKGRYLPFNTLTSLTYYDGVIKTLIHKFKYSRQKFLLSVLNDMVTTNEKIKEIIPCVDVIVPVPLHWLKKLRRGFNQSELLSIGIQKHFLKPISKNNLCRIKNTESQTHLTKRQRRLNIRNAFFVKDPKLFKGKKILLVDDVLTTGVTASECSKKLKKAGAESVHLLILAIADYHSYW